MVLWKDMNNSRGVGSQGHDRTRPTISVCRRDRGVVEERIGVDNDNQQGLYDHKKVDQEDEFPGEPSECLC